jgi:phage terminase large subunit-like protein
VAGEHGATHVARGSMYDNRSNLDPEFIRAIRRKYEGTRLADQEIEGQIVTSVEGALWTPDLIQRWRVNSANVPALARIVIGVDPSGSEEGDYCGIIATGLARKRDALGRPHGFVLDDASVQNRPEVWGAALSELYHRLVDTWPNVPVRVVAEVNFGAALVVDVIHLIDSTIPVDEVRASRGKRIRAEPVALLYDTGQWHHVGTLALLEEQLTFWTPLDPNSPDRMDALVWSACALVPELTRPPSEYSKGFASKPAA